SWDRWLRTKPVARIREWTIPVQARHSHRRYPRGEPRPANAANGAATACNSGDFFTAVAAGLDRMELFVRVFVPLRGAGYGANHHQIESAIRHRAKSSPAGSGSLHCPGAIYFRMARYFGGLQ